MGKKTIDSLKEEKELLDWFFQKQQTSYEIHALEKETGKNFDNEIVPFLQRYSLFKSMQPDDKTVTIKTENLKNELDRIENKIQQIEAHEEMLETQDKHHKELLETQNKHHKENLDSQNDFNKKLLSKQGDLNIVTGILAFATIVLCISTLWTAGNTQQSVELQIQAIELQTKLYSPQITLEFTNGGSFPYYSSEYEYKVESKYWNESIYVVPIEGKILNEGMVAITLKQAIFSTDCGNGSAGSLNLLKGYSRVIKEGESGNLTGEISIPFNTTVQEGLPCDVELYFMFRGGIYGTDTHILKTIVLVKDT